MNWSGRKGWIDQEGMNEKITGMNEKITGMNEKITGMNERMNKNQGELLNVEWINYRFDKSTFEWKNSELTSNYNIFSLSNFIRAIFTKSRVKMNLFCTTKNISNSDEKCIHCIRKV